LCLDQDGHSQFNRLMYRRGEPRFYAFDLLWLNGEDLRAWRLLDRKEALRDIIPTKGEDLFRFTCKSDLEGVVAKWKRGAYMQGDRTSWVKVKNRKYSQSVGREELFKKRSA
jgi:bifunctional non-homologous end joining protein LigD